MLNGKATNYRYSDLVRWLTRAHCRPPKKGGSHETWRHPSGRRIPLVRGTGVLLPAYPKKVARILLEEECQDRNPS